MEKLKKNVANVAGNFRSVSFGKMLQPKMDCRHIVKSAVMQPIPTLYLWNECTTRYDGACSLTSMEILVI